MVNSISAVGVVVISLVLLLPSLPSVVVSSFELSEQRRVEEYYKRNYTWPMENYVPNTPGWKALMERRLSRVEGIRDRDERYEGYISTMLSAFLVPNFTEHGFGLARCPGDLLAALRHGVIEEGLPATQYEAVANAIEGPTPWFVHRPDLTDRVLEELHGYAEAWAGIPLTAHRAYGFRVYRNDSRLYMHVDKTQTHVISIILHVGSAPDSEPWPLYIEDFRGRTHEVILTPGDILFYESSKCLHGRPRTFAGSWYTSVFVHYYPAIYNWSKRDHALEAHYAVPPHWERQPPPADQHEHEQPLRLLGTGFYEPNCPNEWCLTIGAIPWSGPGQEGFWIAPTMERFPFHPERLHVGDYAQAEREQQQQQQQRQEEPPQEL